MRLLFLAFLCLCFASCASDDSNSSTDPGDQNVNLDPEFELPDLSNILTIDFDNLFNYENQPVPGYITRDNTLGNTITDEGATLGRVLFYDKQLSSNNTISCASCHKQSVAFGDGNSG